VGVTKRIYEHEIRDIKSMWISELKKVQEILPKVYNENDIIKLLKEFYPYEWKSVDFKYNYYKIKDTY